MLTKLDVNDEEYSVLTVGELIELLRQKDQNLPIYTTVNGDGDYYSNLIGIYDSEILSGEETSPCVVLKYGMNEYFEPIEVDYQNPVGDKPSPTGNKLLPVEKEGLKPLQATLADVELKNTIQELDQKKCDVLLGNPVKQNSESEDK